MSAPSVLAHSPIPHHTNTHCVQACNELNNPAAFLHKVLNIGGGGGGKVQNIVGGGGERGTRGQLFAGYKLIGAPPLISAK